MIGHALGGAGALEAVAAVATIVNNEIHPTINYEHPDPECDLDYVPNTSRKQQVDYRPVEQLRLRRTERGAGAAGVRGVGGDDFNSTQGWT